MANITTHEFSRLLLVENLHNLLTNDTLLHHDSKQIVTEAYTLYKTTKSTEAFKNFEQLARRMQYFIDEITTMNTQRLILKFVAGSFLDMLESWFAQSAKMQLIVHTISTTLKNSDALIENNPRDMIKYYESCMTEIDNNTEKLNHRHHLYHYVKNLATDCAQQLLIPTENNFIDMSYQQSYFDANEDNTSLRSNLLKTLKRASPNVTENNVKKQKLF